MASRCRKFVPNLFNKSKCQSCFGPKESHTAEALESSKAARKVSKCAYLFVAPDFDFTNPLQRSKRWQRRFFILYDDGELTYSVDDNPGTIPQGSVDMNKCTDVFDAEEQTSHELSLGIEVPGESTVFMKGVSREEIRRWFDVLVMYPRSLTIKNKRPSKPGVLVDESSSSTEELSELVQQLENSDALGSGLSRHHSYYPAGSEKSVSDDDDADSVKSKDSDVYERVSRNRGRAGKHRDIRRCKSEVRPSDLKLAEEEYNSRVASREASPAHSTKTATDKRADKASMKGRDRSIDKTDGPPPPRKGEPETFSSVRSMKNKKANKNAHAAEAKVAAQVSTEPPKVEPTKEEVTTRAKIPLRSTDDSSTTSHVTARSSRRHTSLGLTAQPKPLTTGSLRHSITGGKRMDYQPHVIDANETDEHKIAKSEIARKTQEKSPIARKGWLVLQDQRSKTWSKHWFVLCGTILSYYKDAKAEESNDIDGHMDLCNVYAVCTVKVDRNHGFKISTKEGDHVLSAMTSGIRRNWTEAIESIIDDHRKAEEKSAKQDMGFVFEPPIRSPVTGSAPPLPTLAPVTPNTSSRINATLRDVAEKMKETSDNTPLEEIHTNNNNKERPVSLGTDTNREVSVITNQAEGAAAFPLPLSEPPKSPSQRIKEKSRAKTPPRTRSPPPPAAPTQARHVAPQTSSLLPSGGSSDENDESLTAKLVDAQKEVQHLQQHAQDASSTVRKQRVEIESLQTKLDLTTSQLHDMETALTHSAQNLNKERKNVQKLTDMLHRQQESGNQSAQLKAKCDMLTQQLEEANTKLADQETRMKNVRSMEEQLEVRTNKLATLEKVLGNTRRHLQDAVDNVRDTELQYQTKIEEMEADYEEERTELQERIHELEESMERYVTESHNSMNTDLSDLSSQLVRDKNSSIQRLEEVVKEQRGKLDQLVEENENYRQQVDEAQVSKDRIIVLRNHLETTQKEVQDLEQKSLSLQNSLDSLSKQLKDKDAILASKCQENTSLIASIDELQTKCRQLQQGEGHSVGQNHTAEEVRKELEAIISELNTALVSSQNEMQGLRDSCAQKNEDLEKCHKTIQEFKNKCVNLENDIHNLEAHIETMDACQAQGSTGKGMEVPQVVSLIDAIIRSCERMTESAVAMLAGEMIETEIKCSINFTSEQKAMFTPKACEQVQKKCSGIKQRLNYIVKKSTSKKLYEKVKAENDNLSQRNSKLEQSNRAELQSNALVQQNSADMKHMFKLLQRCQSELLCISSDLDKLQKTKAQQKLLALAESLKQVQTTPSATTGGNSSKFCEQLAVKSAVLFELARWTSEDVDLKSVEQSLKKSVGSSDSLCSIEDTSLRTFATLVFERLLLTQQLDEAVDIGQWKTNHQLADSTSNTSRAMAAEALFRYEAEKNNSLSAQSQISALLTHSNYGRCSGISNEERTQLLIKEANFANSLIESADEQLRTLLEAYCSEYTADLVNYEVINMSQLDQFLSLVTDSLFSSILDLCRTGNISQLSSDWLHETMQSRRQEFNGMSCKGMPHILPTLVMRRAMLHIQFSHVSSLLQSHTPSTVQQNLMTEADKLNALSVELMKKSYAEGSTEARIAELADKLEDTDSMLSVYTRHYGEQVHQVMREVIFSAQNSLTKHLSGDSQPSDLELHSELEKVKLELTLSQQNKPKSTDVSSDYESAVQAMKDEMEITRAEHDKELEESKMDMRMVLKSVKAEEQKMVVELTDEIAQLKEEISEMQHKHEVEVEAMKSGETTKASVDIQNSLKDKIRDLESCLHEMQEEFEEDLYQERQSHLAELDQNRGELVSILARAEAKDLSADEIKQQYEKELEKLRTEQASLQQWIDDIRDAHKDEIEALHHEKDCALADEVNATQAAIEAMETAHAAQLTEERNKLTQYKEKATVVTEVERKLLLQSRDIETKEKHIAQLQEKLSSSIKQLAKFEVQTRKTNNALAELQSKGRGMASRNKQLVDQFTKELSSLHAGKGGGTNAECLALKAKMDNLKEALDLEKKERELLEGKLELLEAKRKGDDTREEDGVKVALADDSILKKRRGVTGRSSSPRVSSPSPSPADDDDVFSPRRLVNQAHDLHRSKSNSMVGMKLPLSRTKRLSGSDVESASRSYAHKPTGISIAERLRKFNT